MCKTFPSSTRFFVQQEETDAKFEKFIFDPSSDLNISTKQVPSPYMPNACLEIKKCPKGKKKEDIPPRRQARIFLYTFIAQLTRRRSRSCNSVEFAHFSPAPQLLPGSKAAFKATERSKMYFELLSPAAPATRPLGVQQCSKL